jgi:hypothetical protein
MKALQAPAPVLTFGRPPTVAPPPPPLPSQASAAPSFIPEEPFGGLHEPAFREPPPATEEAFAPMTEEESATLSAPPPSPSADAASTVMFRVGDLPWNAPVAAPPVAPAEPEPVFVPEPAEAMEAGEESSVFEEVLEEDLDFGVPAYEPETSPPSASASGTVLFRPSAATLPPVPPGDDGTATGAFVPVPDEPAASQRSRLISSPVHSGAGPG